MLARTLFQSLLQTLSKARQMREPIPEARIEHDLRLGQP